MVAVYRNRIITLNVLNYRRREQCDYAKHLAYVMHVEPNRIPGLLVSRTFSPCPNSLKRFNFHIVNAALYAAGGLLSELSVKRCNVSQPLNQINRG